MRTLRMSLTGAVVAASILTGAAETVSAQKPHKVLDLRNQTDSTGDYEVGFCARPSPGSVESIPGHAFVSFSHKPPSGDRTFVAIGHTTSASASKAILTFLKVIPSVPGHLKEEIYTAVREKCLIVKVNEEPYKKALALTKNPLASAGLGSENDPVLLAYKLTAEDCLEFLVQVAKSLGSSELKIPTRKGTELPLDYIRRLIDSN